MGGCWSARQGLRGFHAASRHRPRGRSRAHPMGDGWTAGSGRRSKEGIGQDAAAHQARVAVRGYVLGCRCSHMTRSSNRRRKAVAAALAHMPASTNSPRRTPKRAQLPKGPTVHARGAATDTEACASASAGTARTHLPRSAHEYVGAAASMTAAAARGGTSAGRVGLVRSSCVAWAHARVQDLAAA